MKKNKYEVGETYKPSDFNLNRLVEVVRLTIVITILSLVASLIALSMAALK
jgi:hypothetical protein